MPIILLAGPHHTAKKTWIDQRTPYFSDYVVHQPHISIDDHMLFHQITYAEASRNLHDHLIDKEKAVLDKIREGFSLERDRIKTEDSVLYKITDEGDDTPSEKEDVVYFIIDKPNMTREERRPYLAIPGRTKIIVYFDMVFEAIMNDPIFQRRHPEYHSLGGVTAIREMNEYPRKDEGHDQVIPTLVRYDRYDGLMITDCPEEYGLKKKGQRPGNSYFHYISVNSECCTVVIKKYNNTIVQQ